MEGVQNNLLFLQDLFRITMVLNQPLQRPS